jgi:hypothetical protein
MVMIGPYRTVAISACANCVIVESCLLNGKGSNCNMAELACQFIDEHVRVVPFWRDLPTAQSDSDEDGEPK